MRLWSDFTVFSSDTVICLPETQPLCFSAILMYSAQTLRWSLPRGVDEVILDNSHEPGRLPLVSGWNLLATRPMHGCRQN